MGRSSIPPFPPALEPRRALAKMSSIEHLMIAVVSTAFDDLRNPDARQRDTAVRYFFSDPETHVLSFPSVCRQMDWSLSAVRQRSGRDARHPRSGSRDWFRSRPVAPRRQA